MRIRISHNRDLDAFFPEFIIFGGLKTVLLKIRLSAENFKGVERMGFKQIVDECLRHLKDVGNPVRMGENSESVRFSDVI